MYFPEPSSFNPASSNATPSPRILIVRLSAHGDVIHTLPLLAALKQQHPDAFIGWLVEASALPLLENHPLIDQLHVSHRKRWLQQAKSPTQWPQVWREVRALIRELRMSQYQISFDVQGLLKSALWPILAKIPDRYGFKATREFADRFYNHRLPPMILRDGTTLAVQRYLDFARAIGCPVEQPMFTLPPVAPAVEEKVSAMLASSAHLEWPLVVLAPFTRWPSKHWPLEAWANLLPELLQHPMRVAIIGGPENQAATETFIQGVSGSDHLLNLVGRTDWPDLYTLFQKTRLLIGLDSAPLHIANAVGIPEIIGLYGPTAPGRTGPVGERHTVLSTQLTCQPCFVRNCPIQTHACMKQLTPEMVLALALQQLNEPAAFS